MNFYQLLTEVLAALATSQASFRLGNYTVSVALNSGAPVHLSLSAALLAVEKVLVGQPGVFQSGDVTITIAPYSAPSAPASAAPAA